MNEYTVTISREIIYKTKIYAHNWEDACDKAEHKFEADEESFREVDSQWEVMDYELTNGEEKTQWAGE